MISRFSQLAISCLALMVAHSASAQLSQPWLNAQRLVSECSDPTGSMNWNTCIDYLEGVKDTLNYLREHNVSSLRLPCTPPDITLGQLHDVVVAFIRANPQFYHVGGAPAVYAALISAFPCQ